MDGRRVTQVTLLDGMRLQLGENPQKAIALVFRSSGLVSDLESGVGDTARERQEATSGLMPLGSYHSRPAKEIAIGRDPQSDIHLASPVISRHHAIIRPSSGDWLLQDLNSTNGTYLNGRHITGPAHLQRDDIIQIGPFRLMHEGDGCFKILAGSHGLRLRRPGSGLRGWQRHRAQAHSG